MMVFTGAKVIKFGYCLCDDRFVPKRLFVSKLSVWTRGMVFKVPLHKRIGK